MNRRDIQIILFCFFLSCLAINSAGSVTRENCSNFLQISVKGKTVDFSSTLRTVTNNNLRNAVSIANGEIARYVDLLDPEAAGSTISRLKGIGFYRLGDPNGKINCIIGTDNARCHLVIIDSKNQNSREFKICGPILRRTDKFPWLKLTWGCTTLWGYSCSQFKTFGNFGPDNGEFDEPVNIASYIDNNTAGEIGKGPINVWVADNCNNRIAHLRYTTNGNVEWVNTVGNFNRPVDIAFRDDDETPSIYIAEERGGQITRIPVTNSNYRIFQDVPGSLQEPGIQINDGTGLVRPTGICLNRSGDRNGQINTVTYVYVADAGTGKLYRFLEAGAKLQYINCVSLPSLREERTHIGIRSDKFGTLYVFDRDAGKVLVYSPGLEKLSEFGSPGMHSTTEIKFELPYSGFITEDNLFVIDRWSDNSGLQQFNIGGIDIVSMGVDYAGKTATILSDNAFDKCTYKIDGGTEKVVDGLQFSGSFILDISSSLTGLSTGQHTLTVTLRSAYSTTKTSTKTVCFVVDPNANRLPRNIQTSAKGRRIDLVWDAPLVSNGLIGYLVYANDVRVYQCGVSTRSYSYYAGRDQAGATVSFKVCAVFGQPVQFSNVNNFTVTDNSIEHVNTGAEATARSVQELTQADWDAIPIGAEWQLHCKLDCDPYEGQLIAEPLFALKRSDLSTVVQVDLTTWSAYHVLKISGWGGQSSLESYKGDIIDLLFVKKTNSDYQLGYQITRENARVVGPVFLGTFSFNSFPNHIFYHSNRTGVKISDCIIGNSNTMSTSIPVTLRSAGLVSVDGSSLTLDDAVNTAFNGDNLQLSDAQYTLSVPLNSKPAGDNRTTPVSYTITLNPSVPTGAHAIINYSGPQNLIDATMPNVQATVSITGAIIKSSNPLIVFSGNPILTNSTISFTMQNSVIDAPSLKLIDNTIVKPIPAGSAVTFTINSSTLTMNDTDGFISLDGFDNLTLSMSDNFIYQKDFGSCFCFAKTGTFDICTKATLINNTFLLAQQCTGCATGICTPAQNEIGTAYTGTTYLDNNYAMSNINNPGVTLNTSGNVTGIRGAVKTIGGNAIGSITQPKLIYWPNLFIRPNPRSSGELCYYLPVSDPSNVNISMDRTGTIVTSGDASCINKEVYEMKDETSFFKKQVKAGDLYYCKGEDILGLCTPGCVLSFPGNVVFDEQDIVNYFGSKTPSELFVGKTSTDAASGLKSWMVESQPDNSGGYLTQRTETFYEPLPVATGYESFSFYYKKQYTDQQLSLTFEDENGNIHVIQNSVLPTGTRGWNLTTDAATTNWQLATILLKDEENLPTGEFPLSGKLMRLSIHHQSASASTSAPSYMLFDNIAFHSSGTVVFDENNTTNFTGKGGTDGWDGFTSTDAFVGSKSFQIAIKAGNTSTSDSWTGLNTGVDLPLSMNKRKCTFAYKKTVPTSSAIIKLHIKNMETDIESVFEISEQTNPGDITANGWPIPKQLDTRWHQVFIDLFSVRGVGNTDYPSTSSMPFGKLTKIELCLNGASGDQCLFDDIKFIQDFYTQINSNETYSVSPDYSETGALTGWNINSLGEVGKNTIISYGSPNNISVQELYSSDQDPAGNVRIQNLLEIENVVNISGTDFPKAYLYWKEQGAAIGYIDLSIGCTDGKSYPLVFSPTGYSLNNTRGAFNCKLKSDMTETKHSYSVESVFAEKYPELVNATTPITPTNVNGMKIHYKLNALANWYSKFEYPLIEFKLKDSSPLTVTVNTPVNSTSYGKNLPISLVANKEIAKVDIAIVVDGDIIKQWENHIQNSGQTTFTESYNLKQIDINQLDPNGSMVVNIEVTDIYGNKVAINRSVVINLGIPTVALEKPKNETAYNLIVPLQGSSDLPLTTINYQIADENGNVVKNGVYNYTTSITAFNENITLTDAERSKILKISIIGTSENEMISDPVKRTILINPLSNDIQIGTVINPTITWDSSQTQPTLCNASAGFGGTQDNFQFYQTQILGNFEATVGVKEFTPAVSSAKAGLMVRAELTAGSISDCIFTTTTGAYYQYRQAINSSGVQNFISTVPSGTVWFKMKRVGTVITYFMSTNGSIYSQIFTRTIGSLPVYIGPAFSSGNTSTNSCVTFTALSIEKLPDVSTQLTLGIVTPTKVRPVIRQDGANQYLEDLSTQNGGQTITIGGTTYTNGLGGIPQVDGTPSFCIYDLKSEASRLQVDRFVKLSGIGSTQDGAAQVAMKIKVSSESTIPPLTEWLSPTGLVNSVWDKPATTNPKNFEIDLTNVKWLGIFISSDAMQPSSHGVWANIKLDCIGADRTSPIITTHPQSITKKVGERAVFSVSAIGTVPLTYKWQKNHMDIPGATSSAYMSAMVKMGDDKAVYRCMVTNVLGTSVSADAVLTVLDETVDNVSEFALIAKDQLDIRDQVTIVGSKIQSNALCTIGNDGHVTANVLAVGNVSIGDRTEVTGNILAGGSVSLGSGTRIINGAASGGQVIPTVDIECHPVIYGSTNVTINNGETRILAPGDYQDLHAYSYSILKMLPGKYNFRKFYLESNVALIFTLNGLEKADVNIDNETRFGDYCAMSIDGTAGMFAIKWYSNYAAQEISINPDSRIIGQLIMPYSNVHVYSRSVINGLCHAKTITLEPTAGLNYSKNIPSNNQKPVITVSANAAENPVTHASVNMSTLAIDDGGEDSLIYQWTAPSVPDGAWVNFSINGTNAAKNTVATFSAVGTYIIRVIAQDKSLQIDTNRVTVQVIQGTSQIVVTPGTLIIPVNGTQLFSAVAKDQFGQIMSAQPTFTWETSDGGSIDATGLFTASGTTGGPYTVSAQSGIVTGNSSVTITSQPVLVYQINTGSAIAAGAFSADQFSSGGTMRTVTNTIDITGVTNSAPQAVYQSERFGNSTYTIPNLTPATTYTIRLHFAELCWNEVGKRVFNVSINGTTALSNFDIYAIAGASNKAIVREFFATANSSGQIVIDFNTISDNATVCGIEVLRSSIQDLCTGVDGGGYGLHGNTFGLYPAWSAGSEYCKASDGDVNTFYDFYQADGAYTGLDFGSTKVITKIKYYPRANFSSRMVGGKFQGSNDGTNYFDLYTIATTPAVQWNEVTISNTTAYRYIRYLAPNGGYGNIAEMEFSETNIFPDPAKWYKIATKANPMFCLDVKSGNYSYNTPIQLWEKCNVNQEFQFRSTGDGYFNITCRYSNPNWSIDMSGNWSNGQTLKLWETQQTNPNQKFKLVYLGDGSYRLEAYQTSPNFSIDKTNDVSNGIVPLLWTSDNNNVNQKWLVTEVP